MNIASFQNGKIKLISNVLRYQDCQEICRKANSTPKQVVTKEDKRINKLIYDNVKHTDKYVECNSKYQILKYNNFECEMYNYDLSTSCLDKNWIFYVCLHDQSEIIFEELDIKLQLHAGSGVLIQETDNNFEYIQEHSHIFTKKNKEKQWILVKRVF
jgi:hypothetical protein